MVEEGSSSYAPLPAEQLVKTSWEGSAIKCLGMVGIAGFLCIIGSQGALGEIGTLCPAEHWGPDYADQFLGGGGEGYLREYLGELGILFFFFANALTMLMQAKGRLVPCASVVTVLILISGQLAHKKLVVILCSGLLLVINISDSMLVKFADRIGDQYVLKRMTISGGLVVFLARQSVGPEAVSPFWPVMFGRLVIWIPILQATSILGSSGFKAAITRLGLPMPILVSFLVRLGFVCGFTMNVLGALVSSYVCDWTFTVEILGHQLWVIIIQGIAVPGAEVLILCLIVYTLIGLAWPLVVGPATERMQHWQEMIENAAVIGSLTHLTGSDVWSL